MKAIKTLLAASALVAAAGANATVYLLDATLDSQTGRTLGGDTSFSGSIEVDAVGQLWNLTLTSNDDFTSTIGSATVTYDGGSTWYWDSGRATTLTGVQLYSDLYVDGSDLVVEYEFDGTTEDYAGDFSGATPSCSGAGCPSLLSLGWDYLLLTVRLDENLDVISATLLTKEFDGLNVVESAYSLSAAALARSAGAPEVPLPAAAWLFGSGLVGLLGARRRLGKAAA